MNNQTCIYFYFKEQIRFYQHWLYIWYSHSGSSRLITIIDSSLLLWYSPTLLLSAGMWLGLPNGVEANLMQTGLKSAHGIWVCSLLPSFTAVRTHLGEPDEGERWRRPSCSNKPSRAPPSLQPATLSLWAAGPPGPARRAPHSHSWRGPVSPRPVSWSSDSWAEWRSLYATEVLWLCYSFILAEITDAGKVHAMFYR